VQKESSYLIALLKIDEYRDLFDAAFSTHDGWMKLINTITPSVYDKTINDDLKDVQVAADLMDFRFRYLDHGGTNKKLVNLNHAFVYCYKNRAKKRGWSGRSIRKKWASYKRQAVFLYVSENFGFNFKPTRLDTKNFVSELKKQTNDVTLLADFFGTCAYVSNYFPFPTVANEFGTDTTLVDCFPPHAELNPVRPKTAPLPTNPDGVIKGLESYRVDYQEFKDN
jgi:hypothetical protein